jgi:DNA-binding response OmpR family regulator
LTGDASENDRVAALAAGFDHHMTKPVDMQALTSILASGGDAPR